jgi:thioredoxin
MMSKKFSIKTILSSCLAFILFSCNAPAQNKNVDASTFQQHLSNNDVQLLDVRTMDEYSSGHIKNALLANWMDKEEFTQHVQYLDKEKPVLVYCASGGRSSQAAEWLAENGFKNIENLKGGFIEWRLEKKPVEATGNVAQMTIDDYYNLLKNDKSVLVDFGAAWCPPCKIMQPVLDSLQNDLKDNFKIVKVDAMNTAVMQQLDVSTLPTFIVYKNGKEVWRKQGTTSKNELKKELGE